MEIALLCLLALVVLVLTRYLKENRHWIGAVFLNLFLALLVLLLVRIVGEGSGFYVPINLASVCVVAVLGLPGVGVLGALSFLVL